MNSTDKALAAWNQIQEQMQRDHEAELAQAEWETNDDPSPWCLHCGPRSACDCGPIADNN